MSIEIPDPFYPTVESLELEKYPPHYYLFGRNLVPGEKSLKRNWVSIRHSKHLKELKFPHGHTLYSWKHTGNCDAYRANVGIYDLMRQNRHHSLEQTLKYLRSLGLEANIEFRTKAPAL